MLSPRRTRRVGETNEPLTTLLVNVSPATVTSLGPNVSVVRSTPSCETISGGSGRSGGTVVDGAASGGEAAGTASAAAAGKAVPATAGPSAVAAGNAVPATAGPSAVAAGNAVPATAGPSAVAAGNARAARSRMVIGDTPPRSARSGSDPALLLGSRLEARGDGVGG